MVDDFAKAALDYILSLNALNNPMLDRYKKAKAVLMAVKMIYENKQPAEITKEDAKMTMDIVEELVNTVAQTDAEKERNAQYVFACKVLFDGLDGAER